VVCSGPKRRGSSPQERRARGRHSLSLQQVNLEPHLSSGAGGRRGFGEGGLHLVGCASTIQSLRTGDLGWAVCDLFPAGAAALAAEHFHRSDEKERLHTSHMHVRPRPFEHQASTLPKQIPLWPLDFKVSYLAAVTGSSSTAARQVNTHEHMVHPQPQAHIPSRNQETLHRS